MQLSKKQQPNKSPDPFHSHGCLLNAKNNIIDQAKKMQESWPSRLKDIDNRELDHLDALDEGNLTDSEIQKIESNLDTDLDELKKPELDVIRAKKRELKRGIKSDLIDNHVYQKLLQPLNEQLNSLKYEISLQKDVHCKRYFECGRLKQEFRVLK